MARILAVTSRLPFPPREGHQLRAWHLLRALASRHDVTLLSFRREDDLPDETAPLHQAMTHVEMFRIPCERSPSALGTAVLRGTLTRTPFLAAKYDSAALRSRLRALAREADLVHFDMLPLMAHADCVPAGTPVVLNAHNVEHQLLERRAEIESRTWARHFLSGQVSRLKAFERWACERADAVLACSDLDAQDLRGLASVRNLRVIPNGVELQENRPSSCATDPDRLVFVGQMGWFPNRDGVEWFLREVFPRILTQRPQTRFELVGKADGFEVPEAVAANVTLAGFVDDLRPHVHAAAVYVVPLRAGSGTRLKVLEAMALGKAIVTTSTGSEGIALQHGESALYADDAESFAQATLALLDSPGRAVQLGAAARRLAEAEYGWEAIGTRLLQCYDELLSSSVALATPAPLPTPIGSRLGAIDA